MRRHLAISVLLLGLGGPSEGLSAEPSAQACNAAAHVIAEAMRDHRTVKSWIVDDPHYVGPKVGSPEDADAAYATEPLAAAEWIKLWRGDKPSLELAATPAPPIEQRITECPSLHAQFGGRGVEFGRAARDRREQTRVQNRLNGEPGKNKGAPSVVQVATPIVSTDGREALVLVGVLLPDGGYFHTLHLRRSKAGAWRTTARHGLSFVS